MTPQQNEKYKRLSEELESLRILTFDIEESQRRYKRHLFKSFNDYHYRNIDSFTELESQVYDAALKFQELFSVSSVFAPSSYDVFDDIVNTHYLNEDFKSLVQNTVSTSFFDYPDLIDLSKKNMFFFHSWLNQKEEKLTNLAPTEGSINTILNPDNILFRSGEDLEYVQKLMERNDTVYYDSPEFALVDSNYVQVTIPFHLNPTRLATGEVITSERVIYLRTELQLDIHEQIYRRTAYRFYDNIGLTEIEVTFDEYYKMMYGHYFNSITASLDEIGLMTIDEALAFSTSKVANETEVEIFGIGFNNRIGNKFLPALIILFQLYLLSILNEIKKHDFSGMVNFLFFTETKYLNNIIRGIYFSLVPVTIYTVSWIYYGFLLSILYLPQIILGLILLLRNNSLVQTLNNKE